MTIILSNYQHGPGVWTAPTLASRFFAALLSGALTAFALLAALLSSLLSAALLPTG